MGVRNISTMPAPKKLVQLSSNGMPLSPPKAMPPPPPKFMPPPPPPPKFTSSTTVKVHDKTNILNKTIPETVPDTLVKLMEYGEEDDDDEETSRESLSNCTTVTEHKPFWAL